MVDRRFSHSVLASHRTLCAAMAGADASLLVWLACADQFCAIINAEVQTRAPSLLQRDSFHSDDDRHVLSPVPAEG